MFRWPKCEDGHHKFEGRWDRTTLALDDGPYGPDDVSIRRPLQSIYVGDICVRCGMFVARNQSS